MAAQSPYAGFVTTEPGLVRAAGRLRDDVFGADTERFGGDQLVVTERATGAVVGAAELLPPGNATKAGAEFDLSALAGLRGSIVEVGNLCVHPDHRGGAAAGVLVAALAGYAGDSGCRQLAGRVSLPVADEDAANRAARAWAILRERHLAPAHLRVPPRQPWEPPRQASLPLGRARHASVPPLLRSCLRLGAVVCGPPAHVPARGVADLLLLLRLDQVDERYVRHFGPGPARTRVG